MWREREKREQRKREKEKERERERPGKAIKQSEWRAISAFLWCMSATGRTSPTVSPVICSTKTKHTSCIYHPFPKRHFMICISLLFVIIQEKKTKTQMSFSTSLHIRVLGMILWTRIKKKKSGKWNKKTISKRAWSFPITVYIYPSTCPPPRWTSWETKPINPTLPPP